MKRFLIFLVVLCGLASCSQQPTSSTTTDTEHDAESPPVDPSETGNAGDTNMPNTMALAAESQWVERYRGMIDDKIEVSMELRSFEGITRGTITYKKSGKPIVVLGRIQDDGNFFLREYQPDGLVTGVMSGTSKDGKLTGNWYGTSNGKDLTLSLVPIGGAASGTDWPYDIKGSVAGKYGYHYPKDSEGGPGAEGVLTVKQSGDKVTFTFDCVTGGPGYNMAMMEDTEGVLEGNQVAYQNDEFGKCAFVIRFFDGFAVVQHLDDQYECGFGHNASVEGEFVKL